MKRVLLLALASPAVALAQQVSCPLTLSEGSIKVERAPAGWHGFSRLARLQSAGMMYGHPSQFGYLIPSDSKKLKGGTVDTWEFRAGDEKWLWCGYGSEVIQLAKRMDDSATRCSITGKEERPGVYSEIMAVCK